MREKPRPSIHVVGLIGGECFGAAARDAIEGAEVLVGSQRQLRLVDATRHAERVVLSGGLDAAIDAIVRRHDSGARVCVLASGDPGFFGIVRVLAARVGSAGLEVHPAPSAVAMAFARLGCSWDDAVVVTAHGRPREGAVARILSSAKVAVLTSPENPPQAIGGALLASGSAPRAVAVFTRIGEADESVWNGDIDALAAGSFDPMSVVVLRDPVDRAVGPGLTWGRDESAFARRDGMITKAEVRAVVLGKLALPDGGVMWDVGAGSGSVGIEAALLCPALRVLAVERDEESVQRIRANATAHGASIEVVHGSAPAVLAGLPDPDRAFVGGGGLDVLDAALTRLRSGGVVVASYALIDRAAHAWRRLGNLVELSVARGTEAGDGVRLHAQNPVFVCWGPTRGGPDR